jgi:hypothetical protein
MDELFHCNDWDLNMPADRQRNFCAVQYRRERVICIDCEKGRQAAKEERDMPVYKKTCGICSAEYQGGPTEKNCPTCRASAKPPGGGQKKDKKQKPARTAKKPRQAIVDQDPDHEAHESVKVIETLIAIGAVTENQVDATRKYVREMFVPTLNA